MNILKEDYTHVITHNPLPIPKERGGEAGGGMGRTGTGARIRFLSSILVVLEPNPNSGIQNLECAALSLAHSSLLSPWPILPQ